MTDVIDTPATVDDELERRTTRRRVITIAIVAFVVLAVGLAVGFTRSSEPTPNWVELSTPVEMPDIVLTDTDGEPYDLRAESEGRVTLLYFGYLNCPDACPIHMAVLDHTFEQLAPDVRASIDVVFVTTDPERDSPADLGAFLGRFDPDFVGLTGSADDLRDAQVAAGVPVAVVEPADADGEYLVGHATQVVVFDADGVARRVYPFGVRQSDWLADLPRLVTE
ncbi:protein SCO1/2 [Ilumatobacter fluminis]|uniref:Protein SCO1/2 n=1 Tax=Ilumatobacter fluminis TaxID=467091 RepID=A0A4R7I1R2_9ACTN|nr:SCO family protein [Ilumatobacter fluminis]TDT17120.1 protein SCO1/2 [Ilumatobacter fluminis]